MSRKPKVKWSDRMNNDLLECKRRAKELTSSPDPLCSANGKKKGYICVMKELWELKGYGHLGLKGQNLCDQASGLEKAQNCFVDNGTYSANRTSVMDRKDVDQAEYNGVTGSENRGIVENENQNSDQHGQNANSTPNLDLHAPGSQFPQDAMERTDDYTSIENTYQDSPEVIGGLPPYEGASVPASVKWGRKGDGEMIMIDASLIVKAYNEIITWRKNSFLVPCGKNGRDFIDQITKHINDWNNGTEMQHTALKAAFVLLAVGLQKPSKRSKSKDHQECLARRLVLWKEGEVDTLLREGRMIDLRKPIHRIKRRFSLNL